MLLAVTHEESGKKYKDAVRWKQNVPMSKELSELVIKECKAEEFQGCDLIFSGLDSDVAGDIETQFLKASFAVFSNAKNHRRDPLVPLVVPTVNISHLDLILHQRKMNEQQKGFLACNSNCAVIGLVIPFAAIQARFGAQNRISEVSVVTMQAISGAGYPGVSSMDIVDNVVPFISGEEDKIEVESQKILGAINADATAFEDQSTLKISAACNRVPVLDGHTACVSLRFKNREPLPSAEEVKQAMRDYISEAQRLGCPSAPENAISVFEEDDRPQPRLDRELQGGYSVSVGRVRKDESGIFDIKFVALSHNSGFSYSFPLVEVLTSLTAVIGAAGSSILNAEAAVLKGYA
ncbi:MAG: hypothetical protein Q9166_002058 [cf. Caloplaca sp. 2 TL-2023]